MPLPNPHKDESESDFVSRCMEETAGEFPDQKQRVAVCETQWRNAKSMKEILIYGPIGMGWESNAETIRAELSGGGDFLIRINSAGGGFDEGPAIYNALSRYEDGRVDTEVDGIAYSMAAMILQAGQTRRMAANSVLMVHGSQFYADGSAEDLRRTAEMMDVHTEAMKSAFTSRGIAEDIVLEWLHDGEDHYFTAEQALEAGLIDEITEAIDMAAAVRAIPANIKLPPALAAYRQSEKETTMPDPKAPENTPEGNQATKIDVMAFKADRDRNIREGKKAGKFEEMKRQNAINAFFSRPQFSDPERIGQDNVRAFEDLRDKCLGDMNVTPDAARDAALDLQDGMPSPILAVETLTQGEDFVHGSQPPMAPRAGKILANRGFQSGIDARDKFIEGVTAAFMVKTGLEDDKEKLQKAQQNEFVGMSCFEMARRYLDMNRISVQGVRREQIIGQALVTPIAAGIAHSTSDFSSILENIASKALMRGWDEAPESWNRWARTGTLPDFKQGSRVNLSTFGDLEIVHENGEYKYGTFSDLKEPLQLATYGKLFGISRQALAGDDLGSLGQVPRNMGRAAARKIGDLAYGVLTSNPVLNQDSTEVFHANHNNIATAQVGPPTVLSLDEAKTAMALQTDPAGNTLNIRGMHLICPVAIETTAAVLIAAQYDPAGTAGTLPPNPYQNAFTVTSDARLDSDSSTQWYLLASGEMHDTVEVAFLNGQQTPYLEAQDGWRVDGVEYKVRIDAVAVPLDFRTMYRNAGA